MCSMLVTVNIVMWRSLKREHTHSDDDGFCVNTKIKQKKRVCMCVCVSIYKLTVSLRINMISKILRAIEWEKSNTAREIGDDEDVERITQ